MLNNKINNKNTKYINNKVTIIKEEEVGRKH